MLKTLKNGFDNKQEIFLQGITYNNGDEGLHIVDGQQRMTFFYFLLKYLKCDKCPKIIYLAGKTESYNFNFEYPDMTVSESQDDTVQDVYYFKKTIRLIRERLDNLTDKEKFKEYVLNYIKFLLINLPKKDQAISTFTMMNGNKAIMKTEEIIKAEMLRQASLLNYDSLDSQSDFAEDFEAQSLRSRYARAWDDWMHWWNRDEVRKYFLLDKSSRPLGILLPLVYRRYSKNKIDENTNSYSFQNFKELLIKSPKEAKDLFYVLRRAQLRFEDAFEDAKTYNCIGAIRRIFDQDNFNSFSIWYYGGESKIKDKQLEQYYELAFLGMTHQEIMNYDSNHMEKFGQRLDDLSNVLSDDFLYNNNKEEAFKFLLRLNIDEDNKQEQGDGRKFDFSVWDSGNRSLEHIWPKSKVLHHDENNNIVDENGNVHDQSEIGNQEYIQREDCKFIDATGKEHIASEHSIGNLVLLYKDDNSSFSNLPFDEKKQMLFGSLYNEQGKPNGHFKEIFKSRHLLHTIYKFSNKKWDAEQIAINKKNTIEEFHDYYKNLNDNFIALKNE